MRKGSQKVQAIEIKELEFHVHGSCYCRCCPFKIQNMIVRFRYMWSGLTPCEFDLDFKILGQRSEYKYEANKYYNGPTLASA